MDGPVDFVGEQGLQVRARLTSLAFGVKYYPVRPVTAPQWGVQIIVTLLFPKTNR